jgi:flavin-dependent dehydrogenase
MYDVVVIGGGLAGLTAGYQLSRSGVKVTLLEKNHSPDKLDHPCGAMVSPIKGIISLSLTDDGIYFKELNFTEAAL